MDGPVVQLNESASVRGKSQAVDGGEAPVSAFLGIPYAEPPLGELRFLPPKQLSLWRGERDCTKYGAIPVQVTSDYPTFAKHYLSFPDLPSWNPEVSEDCLFLNVWTPTTARGAALPVMVWFHGGAFVIGAGSLYELAALSCLENVVCVSINYRLNAFGFLTSGDDVIPGNAGVLDQTEALKWVQKHIAAFGGDPDNVTIFGNSAGGMSVSLHMVSELSRGLFRRVICLSGVANSSYVVRTRQQELQAIKPGLEKLGYKGSSSRDMLKFLQSKSSNEILEAFGHYSKVVIDGYFLKDYPDNLYKNGQVAKVELMSGHVTSEALLMINILRSPDMESEPDVNKVRNYVKQIAEYGFSDNIDAITDGLTDVYLKGKVFSDSLSLYQNLVEMISDLIFNGPHHAFVRHYCGVSATYAYMFDHRPSYSMHPDWVRMDHTEELTYILGYPFLLGARAPRVKYTEQEKRLSRQAMSYFANFARNGNPNGGDLPDWPAFTADKRQYMTLKLTPTVDENYSPEKMDFWDKTITKLDTGRPYTHK